MQPRTSVFVPLNGGENLPESLGRLVDQESQLERLVVRAGDGETSQSIARQLADDLVEQTILRGRPTCGWGEGDLSSRKWHKSVSMPIGSAGPTTERWRVLPDLLTLSSQSSSAISLSRRKDKPVSHSFITERPLDES